MLRAAFGEDTDTAVSEAGLMKLAGGKLPGVMGKLEGTGAVEVTQSKSLREVEGR